MPKKQTLFSNTYGAGYCDWGIKRTIREAENISRWNPWLAHQWMDEAHDRISLDDPYYSDFNNAVERINYSWLRMHRFRWFNESSFWTKDGEVLGLTLLEAI
jgi:hypothetical protein